MTRKRWKGLCGAASAMLFAISMTAANNPAIRPRRAEVHKTATTEHWRPETLSGNIAMVDANKRLVVVKGPDGVPFDMIVTRSTQIKSGDQTLRLSDLESRTNQNASIRFVPERRGDVAQSIEING